MLSGRAQQGVLTATTGLVVALLAIGNVVAAENVRPYDDGPLTEDDFRGKPPETITAAAKTVTQFAFEFTYRYKTTARLTTASLDSITITSCIRRDQSWNRHPDDKRLMDHEQGHADIAQIYCLKARLAFRKKLGKGPNVTATASSLKEAAASLDREVRKEMAIFEQATRDADAEYDRQTANGLGGKQAEWRRVQLETLKQLEAEWDKKYQ
jgi:hypothetical protein